jgi:hypothetical protein
MERILFIGSIFKIIETYIIRIKFIKDNLINN